jgi:adenine-specific DNA methylase
MIPKECKRLAEVDFPIAEVSKHSAREKSIRHGHPSTLHLWWARRPLAACRSMLLALLLPDPCDPACPGEFKKKAREILAKLYGGAGVSPAKKAGKMPAPPSPDLALRHLLLKFIADFANWDVASNSSFIAVGRDLVKAAHPEETPLVVDPFAGGGSIPLEALRLGCDAFASDLNPVACLIEKVMLEDIPRCGNAEFKVKNADGEEATAHGLAEALRIVDGRIKKEAEKELADFYPSDPDGTRPIAYLWARTVRCEAPKCGAEIPLVRSFWLCDKSVRRRALKYTIVKSSGGSPRAEFEIFEPKSERDVPDGTVSHAKAKCLVCGAVLSPERLRTQLSAQRGGADVVFDTRGRRIGGALLLAVVRLGPSGKERQYRLATPRDYSVMRSAQRRVEEMKDGIFPDEAIVQGKVSKNSPFRMHLYGCGVFADLFNARQKGMVATLQGIVQACVGTDTEKSILALSLGKAIRHCNAFAKWHRGSETVAGSFALQAISMSWDYPEMSPFVPYAGGLADCLDDGIQAACRIAKSATSPGEVTSVDACEQLLPDGVAACWFTDPPYYDAIPYSDISDLFYAWHKRALAGNPVLKNKYEPTSPLTPKERELIQDDNRQAFGRAKDRDFFEERMAGAFTVGRQILSEQGLGCVVFAHKTTEGWEALLSGMISAGWTVTSSWPIATERGARLRARESAALATSVHLVCRPRPQVAPVGDWSGVLREMPGRVADWMQRLQSEGVRGADLVFACIGPALEIYSRYSKVVDPAEREIPLGGDPTAKDPHKRGYLAYVWEIVGRAALEQVLGTKEATARNGASGALEEDARLTALFLWTLQSSEAEKEDGNYRGDVEDTEEAEDEEEESQARKKGKGFSLIFDVVRRFAQPLGIDLPKWEGRIIETDKGVVRLLPVSERAKQLFGTDGAEEIDEREFAAGVRSGQTWLPGMEPEAKTPRVRGRRIKISDEAATQAGLPGEALAKTGATTLDRVHAAMLLQSTGMTHALRALIKAETDRGPGFLRLANALSALYPARIDEKRLVDAMLLAAPK